MTAEPAAPPLSHEDLLRRLDRLARAALPLWGLPAEAPVELMNLSENATYRVDLPNGAEPVVLRIHRPGYHSAAAIESELTWMDALSQQAGVITPHALPGTDGRRIQTLGLGDGTPADGGLAPRHMVLFRFIEGVEPDESHDLIAPFERLGAVSARLHGHVIGWTPPPGFTRQRWDFEHCLGATPNWGDWRAAPGLDAEGLALLTRQAEVIGRRLDAYGQGRDRFGLIHADTRLANLLLVGDSTRVIDFDDSGFGWFLYDVAAALSFFEDSPKVPDLVDAWLRGYRTVRPLGAEHEAEIPTFIMMRRMVLMAWIGSHGETDLAQQCGAAYTEGACALAEDYLRRFG